MEANLASTLNNNKGYGWRSVVKRSWVRCPASWISKSTGFIKPCGAGVQIGGRAGAKHARGSRSPRSPRTAAGTSQSPPVAGRPFCGVWQLFQA